jgi:hypothetical protein
LSDHTSAEQPKTQTPDTFSRFGYEIIREFLLPDLLGKDTPEILYWAGKRLARKFPLTSLDEIIEFCEKASWGKLTLRKETKNEFEFDLASPLLASRAASKPEYFFQLEAGFLAQQIEFQQKALTEAYEHPVKKSTKVQFTVKWDKKDEV